MLEAGSQSFEITLSLERMYFDECAPSCYQENAVCPETTQSQRYHQFGPERRVYEYLAQSSSTRQRGVTSSHGDALYGRLLPVDGRRKHVPGAVTVSKALT
jgi:hypothetical protein